MPKTKNNSKYRNSSIYFNNYCIKKVVIRAHAQMISDGLAILK